MFYFWGLLAPPDLGFVCLDLFSKLWLQISCYGANLYCGEEDISMFRSSFFFCFSIFRVILIGLWCRGLLTSCNFGVPCTNSATMAMVDVGGAGFVATEASDVFL
ncbi:hypothetical protein RchiOBHm_Chr5g0058611 [Rosa chinensis]|uniref:Uncharacterized protein n=1 Tax=Rosa chinensis TaxID=74649 RepID=A0A2P6QH72_ROSCH|nr:hypothetical protein RchiOBHm_Chr5g0058611 [Rosa chinensis]